MRPEEALDRRLGLVARVALVLEILWLYARVRWGMSRRPLPLLVVSLRAGAQRPAVLEHPAAPFRLAWAVERVLARLPTDSRCLAGSLVLVGLLARRSVQTSLVIGVRPGTTLAAHAWVERDGEPLLPSGGDRYERLTEL